MPSCLALTPVASSLMETLRTAISPVIVQRQEATAHVATHQTLHALRMDIAWEMQALCIVELAQIFNGGQLIAH